MPKRGRGAAAAADTSAGRSEKRSEKRAASGAQAAVSPHEIGAALAQRASSAIRASGTSPNRGRGKAGASAAAATAPASIAAVQMEPTMTLAEVIAKGRRRGKPMKSMGSCVALHPRPTLPLSAVPNYGCASAAAPPARRRRSDSPRRPPLRIKPNWKNRARRRRRQQCDRRSHRRCSLTRTPVGSSSMKGRSHTSGAQAASLCRAFACPHWRLARPARRGFASNPLL
eukprot:COSAG03_NODE_2972_length_2317_cov_174.446799_2_plen_228_part_00